MRNIHCIPEAIADLESQEVPNVKATTKKYDVTRKTLENQQKGKLILIEEFISTYCQCLTNPQERALIELINKLTDQRMPLTTAIIKNLTEEIRGCTIGKNWTASFVYRHKNKLKSLYLKSINNKHTKGEFPPVYKLFYELVKSLIVLL